MDQDSIRSMDLDPEKKIKKKFFQLEIFFKFWSQNPGSGLDPNLDRYLFGLKYGGSGFEHNECGSETLRSNSNESALD